MHKVNKKPHHLMHYKQKPPMTGGFYFNRLYYFHQFSKGYKSEKRSEARQASLRLIITSQKDFYYHNYCYE